MVTYYDAEKRVEELTRSVDRFEKRGRIAAFFSHDATLFLMSKMLRDLRLNLNNLKHAQRALGMTAYENFLIHAAKLWRPTHVHNKRGSKYLRIGNGLVQNSSGVPLQEGDEVAVYQDSRGRLWVRRASEFDDGRFTEL